MRTSEEHYAIGVDFGSDSVRAVIVSTETGEESASAVAHYRRWSAGAYCNPKECRYRQHPQDYIDSLCEVIAKALSLCDGTVRKRIVGMSFDTTASTPALTDRHGTPLALLPQYTENPDAMFILWKDHTAIDEAAAIERLAARWHTDYTRYCGCTYSCEWVWAKMLHCIRHDISLLDSAYSWVEHCDWIAALLAGDTTPEKIRRSRCVAGHKAMWHPSWGGLPDREFLIAVDPLLSIFDGHLYTETHTGNECAGYLCEEWADRLGLEAGLPIGVGAIDCHVGAVGAGITDNTLVKVVGTSTCDILTCPAESIGDRTVRGICGQVDGSVIPGRMGLEAGQAAFGDVYAWYKRLLGWSLANIAGSPDLENGILDGLTRQASTLPVTEDDPVAVDWFNGRRTPDLDPHARGAIFGLSLSTSAPELFKALVEATAFGSRAINERFAAEGVAVDGIIAVGGIAKRSPYVMQVMADVMGLPIRVARSEQACALGAAMYASVAAGIHPDIETAQRAMSSGYDRTYTPDAARHKVYDRLYARYRAAFGSETER